MRLLQINSTVNTGSTGRIVEQIGRHCQRHGHEVHVAYGRHSRSSNAELFRIGSKWDQAIHLLGTRLFDEHGFYSKRATFELIRHIEAVKPDVIHLHNLHGYYVHVGVLFKFLAQSRIPVVWTLHDCWPFTGHCCYYERVGCRKWETGCFECPLTRLYPASILRDNSQANFTAKRDLFLRVENLTIVVVSKWLEEQVKKSFLRGHTVQTIYNGIDLATFFPGEKGLAKRRLGLERKVVILGVANLWSEGKGFRVFAHLAERLPDSYQIVLVGRGLKKTWLYGRNLTVVEHTNSSERLADYYRAADVFVSPSIAETFGMVAAEALACGTPCVVRKGTALEELVDSSVGFSVKGDHPQHYAKAIEDVLSIERYEASGICRRRAEELFSLDDRMNDYLELYLSLLGSVGEQMELQQGAAGTVRVPSHGAQI